MNKNIDSQVISFVAKFTGFNPAEITPATTLFGDLGVDGDDGAELIEAFAEQFEIDTREVKISNYFGPEGLVPWAPFVWLINAFKKGTPEEKAGLKKISIEDLIGIAKNKKWEKDA